MTDDQFQGALASARERAVVEWGDPPPTQWNKWWRYVNELKTRPGEWARVVRGSTEDYARCVSYKSLRPKGAETTMRKIDGEGWSVWARWPEDEGDG